MNVDKTSYSQLPCLFSYFSIFCESARIPYWIWLPDIVLPADYNTVFYIPVFHLPTRDFQMIYIRCYNDYLIPILYQLLGKIVCISFHTSQMRKILCCKYAICLTFLHISAPLLQTEWLMAYDWPVHFPAESSYNHHILFSRIYHYYSEYLSLYFKRNFFNGKISFATILSFKLPTYS